MKTLLLTIAIISFSYGEIEEGDHHKGQIIYKYVLYDSIKIRGDAFTKKYTKSEWSDKFKDDGSPFITEFNISANLVDLDSLKDIKAFVIYYAKDSDIVANCEKE